MRSAKSIGNVENKLESNSDGRGAKSLLPYSKEDIKKAGKYMAMKPGDKVIDIDGDEYILSTVQVLIKTVTKDQAIIPDGTVYGTVAIVYSTATEKEVADGISIADSFFE